MIKILMIEDDLELAEILENYLKKYNIFITNYDNPEVALNKLKVNSFDIIILDLSLPLIDGIEVCNLIRKRYNIPIIISSARSNIEDKVACFSYGADDFLPKPYDTQELILRIKSILRRTKKGFISDEKENNKEVFLINEERMEVKKNDVVLDLTNAEYSILVYLIKKSGFVISREELLCNVESIKYESTYKSIDVLIGRVRNKIESDNKKPRFILSIRGVGYKFINE